MIGSHWLLQTIPPTAIGFGVMFFSMGAVSALRSLFEGRCYDHSLASRPGDSLIAGYLAMVSSILREGATRGLTRSVRWHVGAGTACGCGAIALHLIALARNGGAETVANSYHNLVVVPALSYAVLSTLPVIGGSRERGKEVVAMLLLAGWLVLLGCDIASGNLGRNTPSRAASPDGTVRGL